MPLDTPTMRTRLAQLARYAAVSVVATTTGLTVLAVLVGVVGLPATWSNVIATTVGTVPSFELNRRWVWRRAERSVLRQAVPFVLIALAELVASTLAVHGAADWADAHDLGRATRTGVVLAANVVSLAVLWVAQFAICDRILFRARPVGAGAPFPHGPAT